MTASFGEDIEEIPMYTLLVGRLTQTDVNQERLKLSKRRDRVNFDKAKAELSEKVVSFLERDDNSRVMPGKKDFEEVAKGVSKQKRILKDYLRILHLKFIFKKFDIKI